MSQNYFNNSTYPNQNCMYPQNGPNAVSINIFTPQAYGTQPVCNTQPVQNYYSMYGQNTQPNLPLYPQNYNNMIQPSNIAGNALNAVNETNLVNKTNTTQETTQEKTAKEEPKKTIIPLTDDYIKSLENYMNNENPKIRLIATKDVMERFKEDENRKDNPSLIPLLNKALRDTSPSIRFLALTTLQLGYSVGNEETVTILKEIQAANQDKIGEDSILASEILLKLSAGQPQEVQQGSAS